jgi:hypothetical protein
MARKSNSIVLTKTCTKTGVTVTGTLDEVAELFYRDKTSADGFATWCKAAEKEYNAGYRKALKKAEVERKRDADAKGVKAFDSTMVAAKQRVKRGTFSNRKAKAEAKAAPVKATTPKAAPKKARTFTKGGAKKA